MKQTNEKAGTGLGQALRRTFALSVPATMVATAAVAMVFAIALDGCSSKTKQTSSNQPSQTTVAQNPTPVVLPTPAPEPSPLKAETPKKKVAGRNLATIRYKNEDDGISFRYPRTYKMLPDFKGDDTAWADPAPMNFAQPGGVVLANVGHINDPASSFFKISVNKGLTQEQCGAFATPSPAEIGNTTPVDASDESIPAKAMLRGVEYTRVENATEQTDVKYFHRWIQGSANNGVGACYEFALGVEETQGNTKSVDYNGMFDRLQRIFSTVKIADEPSQPVTAGVTSHPAEVSNPQ
jgi:hypothetical protein